MNNENYHTCICHYKIHREEKSIWCVCYGIKLTIQHWAFLTQGLYAEGSNVFPEYVEDNQFLKTSHVSS